MGLSVSTRCNKSKLYQPVCKGIYWLFAINTTAKEINTCGDTWRRGGLCVCVHFNSQDHNNLRKTVIQAKNSGQVMTAIHSFKPFSLKSYKAGSDLDRHGEECVSISQPISNSCNNKAKKKKNLHFHIWFDRLKVRLIPMEICFSRHAKLAKWEHQAAAARWILSSRHLYQNWCCILWR